MNKIVYLAVTSDLAYEQRLDNIATSLHKNGYNVHLIGTKKTGSHKKEYKTKRFKMLSSSGRLFNIEFNIRLFFYLLFSKMDIIVANDIDTIIGAYWAAKLKKKEIVFDCRKLYTETPEISSRYKASTKKYWENVEKNYIPKIKHVYTTTSSIANEYQKNFDKEFKVIHNYSSNIEITVEDDDQSEIINLKELFPNKKIMLFQGSLTQNRGVEYLIKATEHIDNAVLVIIGEGYLKEHLEEITKSLKLTKKVFFIASPQRKHLHLYTKQADLGVTLEEYTSKNFYVNIPTNLFDYINNEIPVLVSKLPEMEKLVSKYEIGIVSESYHPLILANKINKYFNNAALIEKFHKNIKIAKSELNWAKEEPKLIELYNSIN